MKIGTGREQRLSLEKNKPIGSKTPSYTSRPAFAFVPHAALARSDNAANKKAAPIGAAFLFMVFW
jgi:hypothetical protein